MRARLSALLVAGLLAFGLAGCYDDPIAQTVCEAYGGTYSSARVPACLGRDWTPSAAQINQCVRLVMFFHGKSHAVAYAYC